MKITVYPGESGDFVFMDDDGTKYRVRKDECPDDLKGEELDDWVRQFGDEIYPQDLLRELFQKYERDEYLKFDERVEPKRSKRADLHAFLLLDELVPGARDIVACAEHDEIYLDVDLRDLAKVATEEQVIELVRCGVRVDEHGLCMFC